MASTVSKPICGKRTVYAAVKNRMFDRQRRLYVKHIDACTGEADRFQNAASAIAEFILRRIR
jgi:hypothetical protein